MTTRLAFIDWMKAIGMFLIVYGHVGAGQLNLLTPPIYPKQWGVAFFLFATGFTLARETRPAWRVVLNRLFEIVLVGGAFAVATTLVSFAMGGRGQLSNFWPFLLGANVFVDAFPANPTTWYIGTYMHVILLWALVGRHVRATAPWLAGCALFEIVARAVAWTYAGSYVAYMLLPNWLTVVMLGLHAGQHREQRPASPGVATALVAAVAPLVLGAVVLFDTGFPFRAVTDAGAWSRLLASVGVTALYLGVTWVTYAVATRLPRLAFVEFLARQTVFIFVAHMPVFYLLVPLTTGWPRPARAFLYTSVCYVGLAIVGALVYRLVQPSNLREYVAARLRAAFALPAVRTGASH